MHTPCPICRETHEPRGLSFDGKGLNSCGMYRSRLATLTEAGEQSAIGPELEKRWNCHVELVAALTTYRDWVKSHGGKCSPNEIPSQIDHIMDAALQKAKA